MVYGHIVIKDGVLYIPGMEVPEDVKPTVTEDIEETVVEDTPKRGRKPKTEG